MVYAARPVTRVANPGSLWQYGSVGAVSGSWARRSQLSRTVLPVLRPPWNVRPFVIRAARLIRMPLYIDVWPPKLVDQVVKLSVCPDFVGFTLYSPEIW